MPPDAQRSSGPGRLRGEIALVTGSTTGLGRAIAERFAREGAAVAITGRHAGRGQAVVDRVAAGGGHAAFRAADLTVEGDCGDLVSWVVETFGGLTVLVNNAATAAGDSGVHDLDTWRWDEILRVNLTAAAWLCRESIGPMLDAEHGSILNISSRAGARGTPGHAAYSASKGGLDALTRSIAVDYADQGIRCNAIAAGYVLNEVRDRDVSAERRSRLERMHLTRLTEPDDVAHAAVYLASRESETVTGVVLPVDGGSTMARAASFG